MAGADYLTDNDDILVIFLDRCNRRRLVTRQHCFKFNSFMQEDHFMELTILEQQKINVIRILHTELGAMAWAWPPLTCD